MAHELKAKHIQTETLENKADDRILLRNILSYIEDHSSSFEDEDVVSKRFVEERLSSIGEEKYIGSIASIESVDDDISDPEEDMLIVTRDTLFVYWYDGDEWQKIGGGETPESIKVKYESNENTNAFTDANQSKLAGIAAGATKNDNTDELSEGTTNKYFTEARAVASKLAGYVKAATVSAISSATSILEAIGILEKALDNKVDKVAGSGLITDAEKLIFADKYTKNETDNLISGAISSLIWKDDVAEFADLATEYPDAIEGWTSVVNDENKIYRFDGTDWVPIGDITIPMATDSVDGKMSKEDFVKLRDIEAEATKNTDTDELDEGTTNKYFTDARAVAAKIDGYVKAETPIPLAETDSILQALGKLEGLLDTKIPIRGDNFIATRPTANKAANGTHLQNIINELASFTPGGNPLSDTNRAYALVMPGEYGIGDYIYLSQPFIDIIGFGSKNGIIINGYIETGFSNQNHRIENITVKGAFVLPSNTSNCTYKNLTVDQFWGGVSGGLFENIEHSGSDEYLFEFIDSGTIKGIYTPNNLSGDITINFTGIIEDCRVEGQNYTLPLSGIVIRSFFKGDNMNDGIFDLYDGAEISYTTIINESDQETGTEWAVTNFKRYGAPDTDKEVRIHHCHFVAKDGALSPKVINTIENGHNTWDSEGGEGIEDIIAGSNVSIDKTDPKNPVISSTGTGTGLTPEQEAKLENTPDNTIEELADKVDKEEGKGLSSNDYTSTEKDKLGNIESEAQKNVQSDWNQENSNFDDYIKNKPSLFSGSYNDLEDVPSSFPSTIEDVNGLDSELGNLQDQITTNEKERIFVVNFRDKLEYTFEWTESIKINSIKVKPGSGQIIDLGDYVLGTTLAAWTPLEITSNQFGVVELIGELTENIELEPETLAFQSRVLSDGGKILDINKLDAFYKVNKFNGLYNSLQFAVSKQFGYKLDGSGNIIKIYDASKNGNDLDISRGTVPEDLENEMFFLYDAHFKNENVVMDSIPESFTTSISLFPEAVATGATYKAIFSLSNNDDGRIEHCYNGIGASYIHRESLRLKYNENALITLRGQTENDVSKKKVYYRIDGVNKRFTGMVNNTQTASIADGGINPGITLDFTKIVLGGTSTEWVDGDADCHVGDTFFYNELLTTDELNQINGETPISEVLNFGFATDIHFSSKTPSGGRNYPDGLVKLQEAVDVWNTENVDFVLLNGDLIDHGGMTKSTAINELGDLMENAIGNITAPTYFSIGNHDIDVLTKSEFMTITQMNEKYYSFDLKGIHFIVLDTCYNSFSDIDDYNEGNYTWQTAYINPSQLAFIENDLDLTELPTVVICHHRIDNEGDYGVKNAADIRTVLEASGKVIAVVQGHQHTNAKTNINGIVYYEMMAATMSPFPANAYSIIRIYDDNSIKVDGFGSQSNYI